MSKPINTCTKHSREWREPKNITLHFAYSNNGTDNIPEIKFKYSDDILDYFWQLWNMIQDEFIDKNESLVPIEDYINFKKDTVWLLTTDAEHPEITITDNLYEICDQYLLFHLVMKPKNVFFQAYSSYEEAYEVALLMKEEHPLCYKNDQIL